MKKFVAAVLCAVMAVSLAGCQKKKGIEDILDDDDFDIGDMGTGNNHNSSAGKKEKLDPFSGVNVTFTGIAPYGQATINNGNTNVKYTPDKNNNLKNGDVVTVKAELKSGNYELTSASNTYTVSGLAKYVSKIDEIPADVLDKINAQTEDLISSKTFSSSNMKKKDTAARDAYSFEIKNKEFVGYYLLTGKEGINANPYNYLYSIYKVTCEVIAYEYDPNRVREMRDTSEHITMDDVYYAVSEIDSITLLEDGTCSFDVSKIKIIKKNKEKVRDELTNYYGYKLGDAFSYYGYHDLDSFFDQEVTSVIDKYAYETTIKQ